MAIRLAPRPAPQGAWRSSWAALGVTLALALSACGSDDSAQNTAEDPAATARPTESPTPSPDPGVKPADGPVLKAQGFSFHAPQGWADVTDRAETGVLLSAAHAADEQPLAITVRRVAPGPAERGRCPGEGDRPAEAGRRHRHPRASTDTTVGGNPAAHVVGVQRLRGTHYQLDVYYVRTPKAGWPLMFATDQYTTGDRREAMLASVLETCHWQQA